MSKQFITNRKGLKIAVLVEESTPQKGLVFVMHGFWSTKDRPGIQSFADAFRERGYTAVRFDTTNGEGESDGNHEDATTTNYYEDLEDVIVWAKTQAWYHEPFCLLGSSLGGLCVALYAIRHPGMVHALALNAPIISGQFDLATHSPEEIKEWGEKGFILQKERLRPDVLHRRPWKEMEDRLRYDLLPDTHKLVMPVIIMVGEEDTMCPLKYQKIFFEKLSGEKELHIIPGMQHSSQDPNYRIEMKKILQQWIDSLDIS